MRTVAAALVLSALAAAATAEPARPGLVGFTRLGIPEDVPAHLTSALAQDRRGFLWIGTQTGLVRWDGYGFRVFKSDASRTDALPGSYVRALHAFRDGRLWVGTFSGGLSAFDPATETFVRYPNPTGNRVEGIAEDKDGQIWVATSEGLDRLDPRTGRFERFRHDPGDPASVADDLVRGLLVDRQGRLWVGSRDGLQQYLGNRQGFRRIGLAGELVSKLYEDRKGRIWIGTTEHGGAVFDPENGRLTRLPPLSHFWVYGFAEVQNEMWVATFGGGIDVIDPGTLAVIDRLRHDPTLENTIGGDRVGALLTDRSGAVWVGTWGQGLARHDPSTRALRSLRASPNRPEGLTHPSVVRALEMQDGTIWAGTNGNGVDVLDREGRRIGGFRADPADSRGLSDGSVTCLAQGSDGTAWVATLDGVLHRQAPGSWRFDRITREDGLPGGPIRAMTFAPNGDLWLGAAEGMARVEAGSGRITAFRHRPEDPASLSGKAVEALAFTPDGTLWVGTDSGLNAFDPARGTAVAIHHQQGQPDSLPDDWVPDLLVASDGRLWVATSGGAAVLDAWDGRQARFTSVAARTGRPNAPVEALIEDRQGRIWLGPRLRLDPRKGQTLELGPAEGCAFRNFFIASRSRTRDGRLLFGSPEGLLVIDPAALRSWTWAPPVVATALRVGGVIQPGAAERTRITLPADVRVFRLDFASLDLTAPQRLRYRYRLEGYDPDWIRAEPGEHALTYTRLPPGDYRLRVQGTNRAGIWSPHELRLAVAVPPAFRETAPARLAGLAGIAGLIYAGYWLRIRQLSARSRELERQVALRTGELAQRAEELAAAYRRIEEASLTDPLTGLGNRRFLAQAIGADLEIAARRHEAGAGASEADLVFLLIDLDHFKSVNDTWGHAAGDAVLTGVADVLRATFRPSDHLVRWGGEEFLVVARFVDSAEAPMLAERLRAAVAERGFELPDGSRIERTCSIGFASYPVSPLHPREVAWEPIVEVADRALYAAKRSGRNGWVGIVASGPEDPAERVARFRSDPAGTAERGEVRVLASPRFELVRWD